jgi:hypothetical protein
MGVTHDTARPKSIAARSNEDADTISDCSFQSTAYRFDLSKASNLTQSDKYFIISA